MHGMVQVPWSLVRCRAPARRSQDGFEQLTSVRFLENLADPHGGVSTLRRAGIRTRP